jgi:glycerol uptake facilitator-like aquaporin
MAERLAGGNLALALLGNTLPTGAMLTVLIVLLGPISGAHFNPAVSAVMALRGDLAKRFLVPYVVTQIGGAIAGVWLAHLMFDIEIFQVSTKVRASLGQFASEMVAAFGLLLTIFGCLARPHWIAPAVGLYITAAYWFTASTSFANPAVTIARALTNTFSGIAPSSVPAFIVAQFVGAAVAYAVSRLLWHRDA